ncbi:MAG: flagellar biosynthesis anti-sigma factor FlgM [Betaproteobacteria bacterium]|nr:flagellar biosynthesis anti-sigma factor FlgM [Betaproteobacteria bacterium]
MKRAHYDRSDIQPSPACADGQSRPQRRGQGCLKAWRGFKKISERLKKEPDFDRSKVDSIKQAIQNGQYPLNPRRIAESFVALENLISN